MKPFSLLIKPASADCNLRCDYCFYLDKAGLYPESPRHRMPDEVLERLIASYMSTSQPQYQFGWQGGEPSLMGNGFFRKAASLQQKHGRPGAEVANGLQTNATLISDELAATLSHYKFLAGVSLDGPRKIHDRFRKHPGGRGSHAEVLKGIETLRKHNVEFNALTLVNSENVKKGAEVYNYLKSLGIFFHQYIPCVEFDDRGGLMPYSIKGPEWGDFLLEIFEEWIKKDTRRVSVRLFDSVLNLMVLDRRTSCSMAADCRQYFLVEYNGDVYPCDFFVEPGKKLGSIMEDDWESLLNSSRYIEFGRQKSRTNRKCSSCAELDFCMGDCPKHRIRPGGAGKNLSALCRGWEKFYRRALPEFRKISAELKREHDGEHSPPARNSPCPCGSGAKYKKCCGKQKNIE